MTSRSLLPPLAGTVLAVLTACGGGGGSATPAPASRLVYTDPPGPGFRFARNPGLSTDSHLVLDLLGPDTGSGRGVAFTLTVGAGAVAWDRVAPGDINYMQNILFDLGSGIQIIETRVTEDTLLAGAFQKGPGNDKPLAAPLCRIALSARQPLTAAPVIPIQVVRMQFLPAVGGQLQDAPCAIGTLAAQ